MSIILEKVIKNSEQLYNMKLLAGEKGLKNIVQWVHVVEQYDMDNFLIGNEIILTTGVALNNKHTLLDFVKKLYSCKVTGIIINIGPHISKITNDVIDFCNEKSIALFSLPWDVKLEEVTRDFCRKIVNSEDVERNIISIFKDIIFDCADYDKYTSILERNSFRIDSKYTIIAIYNKNNKENAATDRNLKFHIEKIVHRINDSFVLFAYKKYRIVILSDYSKEKIDELINKLNTNYLDHKDKDNYVIGISSLETELSNISEMFIKTIKIVKLAVVKNKNIIFYDDIGIYQILLAAKADKELSDFYNKVLAPIEKYDNENKTNFIDFIKTYLEHDGSVQAVADVMFVHRNTVNYQINKIKKITGKDLGKLDVKLNFLLCLYIRDLL